MEFSKRINKQLSTIILVSISILILINISLISYSSNKASEVISNSHYNQILGNVREYSEILKATTEKVANNEKIINLLDKHRDIDDFSEDDKTLMKTQLEIYESILHPITFIKNINVLSVDGQYLFSNGYLYDEFNIRARPWFKEEYLNNYKYSLITDVHKDFRTGQHTIGVIKFIYSESGDTLLGAASLDIFVEDLLNYIDTGFYLGELNAYVDIGHGKYISKYGIIDSNTVSSPNTLIYSNDILDGKISILFMFDKTSMLYNKQMKSLNTTICVILIALGLLLSMVLVKILKFTFKPIMNSLDKLKILLKNLEKNNFDLQLSDEFEQLELISESLSKSFDKKIQSLIYYDELTALPNRKMLFNLSNELIKNQLPFALIFIDLNKFKHVNDIFGHSAGDELLCNFSKSLERVFLHKGIVTRYSGDEFVILYNNYTTDSDLLDFYNNVVLKEFTKPISFGSNNLLVEFSAGVAIYPRDGKIFDDLIRKSDFMMYNCKKTNDCNNLLFFNDNVYTKLLQVEDVKLELKNAIEKNEFLLYYQPIVSRDSSITKVEALIRWQSEKFGFISPGDFINYAEEIGEIVPMGYWIIEEVCKNFSILYENNINLQISINVSPIQLMSFDFAENVKKIINKYNMDFKNLCFEITESVVLDENIIVYDNIYSLHKMGASIALDDFGTGYSSFGYLNKYKLDILKIDRMFIANAKDEDFNIVENIKNIAHLLNMNVVIEGVETEEQFEKLNNLGCDYFQGYYFSKPVSFDELKKMLI